MADRERHDDPFYDEDNQRKIDAGLEFEPRRCAHCGVELINGELSDLCEPCHNQEVFGDPNGRDHKPW